MPFDPSEPENRPANTLRAFWQRYCPAHRLDPLGPQTPLADKPRDVGTFVTVRKLSTDFGATCYLFNAFGVGECIDFEALERDGRIRPTFDRDDLTPGDYTYAEDTETLYLTGTGERLWQALDRVTLR